MNKNVAVFVVLSITFILLIMPFAAYGNGTASLYIDPSLVQKHPSDVGTTFSVDVTINGVTDLLGFDVNITWDNSLITLVSTDYDTDLTTIWGTYFIASDQIGAGYRRIAVVGTGGSFTGTNDLMTLTFNVASATPGQTLIHFKLDTLSDHLANSITHTTTDGTYKMLSTGPPVGGEWVPVNTLQLLAPWVGLVSLIALATALLGSIKRRIR